MSDWFPPQEPDYGNDCLTCYPANLTPRVLGVSLSGIERGALWLAWMGQPPNGTFIIEQTVGDPCVWLVPGAAPLVQGYELTATRSIFTYQIGFFEFAFYANVLDTCLRFFANEFVNPAVSHFYGGQCQVIPLWEVEDPIDDITPIVDPDPLLKFVPIGDEKSVLSYIDRWGDTKIKMLVDFSLR